ncbi:uncharacterized protein [Watersipora subatra]|uniref:uncharacterized protein isoform X2 n=1 Tax=Watersipora subatra TaxID=2589382 RepID=UPI00355AE562
MIYGMAEVLMNQESSDSLPCLPSFLQPPVNPITKSRLYRDFFMLTEFTEDLGPVPVRDYIIPDRHTIENERAFNLDDFSIKIMSADYFVQAANQASFFRMPEDMHAVISHAGTDCYTLLYAFTLYDMYGRGYVRPLYLAYTSSVRDKIVSMYHLLSQAISKAVHRLVHGNIRRFADELQYDTELHPIDPSLQDEVPYVNIVLESVKAKLDTMGSCCDLLLSARSRSGSVGSDWCPTQSKGDVELRQISELSDYWSEFQQDLYKIYSLFSQHTSQIMQCLREEQLACDTFNSLNIGGSTFALLRSHKETESRSDDKRSLSQHNSTASTDSLHSVSSVHHSSTVTSPITTEKFIFDDVTLPSSESANTVELHSHISNLDACSLGSDGAEGFVCEQISFEKDYYSISTDSLLSRNDSFESGTLDPTRKLSVLSDFSSKLIGYNLPLDLKHQDLKAVISEHREHVRDLIYSVLTSRPVVLIEQSTTSKESEHEKVAKALTSFIPFQMRARTHCGFHIVRQLTLKSICTLPITCFITSDKSEKVAENVKAYASVYHIQSKSYEGLRYAMDGQGGKRSRGALDLFYRKRKHLSPYFTYLIESQLMMLATKAQLLHSILQGKQKITDAELLTRLAFKTTSDLNIVKNLVHVVLKQQYISSQGLKEEDIAAMSLMLTLT